MSRPLFQVANDIRDHWTNVRYSAEPYLRAMGQLVDITDKYGEDSGVDIVLYFLSNATYWRGEDAKRIKAELKAMVKEAQGV